MRKRGTMAVLAIMLVISMMFSACASNASAPTQATTQASAQTSAAASKLKGDLTYWSMWNETEPQAEVVKAAIDEFKAANPDVNVTVQWNGRDIRKTLKAALDANQAIDIYENDPSWLAANLGTSYALKLDDYYAKTYASTGGKTFKDTIIPSLVNWVSTLSKDQGLYYVPNQPFAVMIFYNKEHFQKANIDKAPQTWEEFLSDCEKLKAAGFTPLTVDDAYMDIFMGQYLGRVKGDEWVSQLMKDTTGEMWKDPAIAQFAKAYEELYKKGYISKNAGSNKYPAGQQELGLGEVSMYLNGSWLPNEIAATTGPDFKWCAFPYPNVPNGVGKNTEMMFGAQGFAINKNSKNPDAAFELLTYLLSKKTQEAFVDKTSGMPTTMDTKWPAALADVKPYFEGATKCEPWGSGIGDGGDFTPIALSKFTELISGKVTADKFISDMTAAAKR